MAIMAGITIDIRSWSEAEPAYDAAKNVSPSVIVGITGRDHRVLSGGWQSSSSS